MSAYLVDLHRQRALLAQLAYSDFRARFSGSVFGFAWAFVQPLLTIVMYLFVNRVGFRPVPLGKIPFVLWLITGIAPWFYFADGLTSATTSLVEYSYLVRKIVFNVAMVPAIKLASAAITQIVVLAVVMAVVALSGFPPQWSWLQVPYYFAAMVALLSGLSLMTAAITVFLRDVAQLVAVGMQFLFWLTPIAWSLANVPERYTRLVKLNPIFYVIDGMRDSLLVGRFFWQKPLHSLYFWTLAATLHIVGHALFQRLRPHFADVL